MFRYHTSKCQKSRCQVLRSYTNTRCQPMRRKDSPYQISGTMHNTTATSNDRLQSGHNNTLPISLNTSSSSSSSNTTTGSNTNSSRSDKPTLTSQLGASNNISVTPIGNKPTVVTQLSNNNTIMAPINNSLMMRQPSNKHMGIIHTNSKDARTTRAKGKHTIVPHMNSKSTSMTRPRMAVTTQRPSSHLTLRIPHSSKAMRTM
jgi:hypothetical protein